MLYLQLFLKHLLNWRYWSLRILGSCMFLDAVVFGTANDSCSLSSNSTHHFFMSFHLFRSCKQVIRGSQCHLRQYGSLRCHQGGRQGSNFMREVDRISTYILNPATYHESKGFKQDQTPEVSKAFVWESFTSHVLRWYVGVAHTPVVGFRKRRLKSCTLGHQHVDPWHLCFLS